MATFKMSKEEIPQILGPSLSFKCFQNFSLALGKSPAITFGDLSVILVLQRQNLGINKMLNFLKYGFDLVANT